MAEYSARCLFRDRQAPTRAAAPGLADQRSHSHIMSLPMSSRAVHARILAVLFMVAGVTPVTGQQPAGQTRTEHVVAVDRQGRMFEIRPALARQLGLFATVDGFEKARLFRGEDGRYVLEVVYLSEGRESRQRRWLSPAEAEELRKRVSRQRAERHAASGLDQSGRGELIFDQVLMSLFAYGPAVPMALDLSSTRASVAAYMLTNAAGFYLPHRLTRDRDVTQGHRQLAQYGATRGVIYGLLLEDMLVDGSDRVPPAFVLGTSIAGTVAGFGAADRRETSRGQAQLDGVLGDFGLLTGAGLAYVTGLYDESGGTPRAGHALTLASGGAGLWLGEQLGSHQRYTRGDACVLRSAQIAGALAALPLVNATGTESKRAHVGGALAGHGLGVAVGNRLMVDEDFAFGEALIVASGQLAGAMMGLGLTYLADVDGDFNELPYLTAMAAGSAAGLVLTVRMF